MFPPIVFMLIYTALFIGTIHREIKKHKEEKAKGENPSIISIVFYVLAMLGIGGVLWLMYYLIELN